jgi:3-hydroxy-9,10-secoandrosta-1,3,5(10)-triene-9,17-dione monooxygenase reductase component
LSDASLREVMRTFPQGVVVVTAMGSEGPRGITVSSFLSLSLDPPWVLMSIWKESRAHEAIARGRFTVSTLAEDQGALSDHFARPNLTSEEQFRNVAAEGEPPKLSGCLSYLDCRVVEEVAVSDHTLFIGEVEKAALGVEGRPLVFFSRQYWGLGSTVHRRD